jgi:hypothetical protein
VKDLLGEELDEYCTNCGYVLVAGEEDGSFWIGGVRYPPHSLVEEDGWFWLDGQLHPATASPYPRWSQPQERE